MLIFCMNNADKENNLQITLFASSYDCVRGGGSNFMIFECPPQKVQWATPSNFDYLYQYLHHTKFGAFITI